MSNQWNPPPSPGSPFGAPPQGPQQPYPQQQYPQPYPQQAPPGSSGMAKGCLIGGGIVTLILIGACVVGIMVTRSAAHKLENGIQQVTNVANAYVQAGNPIQVFQAQATMLGVNPADMTVCQYNSPELNAETPCASYVGWISTYAPFLPGATLSATSQNMHPNAQGRTLMDLTVVATGPRGTGTFQAQALLVGTRWMVRGLRGP